MFDSTPVPRHKGALAPDVRRLDDRAARAWTERMAVRQLPDGRYAVETESDATYVVDADDRSCTCPDHAIRDETCKHLRRVAIEITSRRVPPPGRRRATCEACGVEAFVDADPPHLCGTCRLDPGDVVRDRETDDRLVVSRVTGRRADETRIEAADCTVADYETNEGYPDDDVVVEAAYLADAARSDDPATYSFPRSRLDRVDDAGHSKRLRRLPTTPVASHPAGNPSTSRRRIPRRWRT